MRPTMLTRTFGSRPSRRMLWLVDGLGDFGEEVAGDEGGAALRREVAQKAAQPVDALGRSRWQLVQNE